MNKTIIAVVASVVVTAGVCYVAFSPTRTQTGPTIDGSSERAFTRSVDEVMESLPREHQDAFMSALTRVMLSRLHGMTAAEILVAGGLDPSEGVGTLTGSQFASARLDANESAAIATLKNLSSAQAQTQASGVIDANNNGAGEYGFLAELAGAVPVRDDALGGTGFERMTPPVLSGAFGNVVGSCVTRSGYNFQVYLPGETGTATPEAPTGGGSGIRISPSHSEVLWCAYAWPTSFGETGKRAFFISQSGDVLACRNTTQRYSGTLNAPGPNAAFLQSTANSMGSTLAANATGKDGELWIVVN